MRSTFRILGAAIVVASMIALAGCSGPAATDSSTTKTSNLSPEAQAASKIVQAVMKPVAGFTAPGPAVDGKVLAGRTVYYIPANQQAPALVTIGDSLKSVLDKLGAKLQICDAQSNPADAASCVNQAIDAKAGAVITAGLPKEFAPAAFDALLSSGTPWVQALTDVKGDGDPAKLALVTFDGVQMQAWGADWVIANSNAKAKVLAIKLTDTPATTAWADFGMLATYKNGCPDCAVKVIEINTGQVDRLPSLVSSALIANPDITYVQAQFGQLVPSVIQGVQAAGRDDVKVLSVDAPLSSLQQISAGSDLTAAVGYDTDALAWYIVDAAVRLADGSNAVVGLTFPYRRIFEKSNVTDLALTPAAEASGEWYSKADYRDGFLKLWGVK